MCSHDALTNVAFGLRAPIHLCHQSWAHNCQRKIVYPIPWIKVVLRGEWAVIVCWVAQAGLHSSIVWPNFSLSFSQPRRPLTDKVTKQIRIKPHSCFNELHCSPWDVLPSKSRHGPWWPKRHSCARRHGPLWYPFLSHSILRKFARTDFALNILTCHWRIYHPLRTLPITLCPSQATCWALHDCTKKPTTKSTVEISWGENFYCMSR